MNRYNDSDEDWEESSEWEEDSSDDLVETVPCPRCGAEIYEDAVRCPACGEYVTHSTSPWIGRPGWWVALALLGILATIWVLAGLGPW